MSVKPDCSRCGRPYHRHNIGTITTCPIIATYVPAQAELPAKPAWIEFRPEEGGDFDELVARFADGMVHAEMMSDKGLYIGFYWDDGRLCQVWVNSKKRLQVNHAHEVSEPPRFAADGTDRKPWLGGLVESAPTQEDR